MKLMVVGDTHGYKEFMLPKIWEAGKRKIQHVVVVGDFGLWTHKAEGQEFLDEVQEAARINNLSVYAIGGNHENWDHWNWMVDNLPTSKGFAMVRRRVLLAPKVHSWTWDHKFFVGAGGAVSIDKAWRLMREKGWDEYREKYIMSSASGPGTLWWPDEELTDQDVMAIQNITGQADYLFTHDCSNFTQWKNRLKPDADSERHRRRIDKVIASTKAKMHFHGHMHEKYDWLNSQSHGFYSPDEPGAIVTQTYGLECNKDFDSWGVLDTETNEFAFRGEGMTFRSLEPKD